MSKLYRDYGVCLLFLAASALLAVVLLLEWFHFRSERAELKSRLATKVEVNLAAANTEEDSYGLPDIEEYSDMVDRPLFIEGRRPPDAEEASADASAVQTPLTLKLMGVVFTPRDKTALLVDLKGKYKRARKNTVVDGWKLVEVEHDKVILTQGEEQRELRLLKPKPKSAASGKAGHAAKKPHDEGVSEAGSPEESSAEESPPEEESEGAPEEYDGEPPPEESETVDEPEDSAEESPPSDEATDEEQ
jgi:type II secretory pathway component PulC